MVKGNDLFEKVNQMDIYIQTWTERKVGWEQSQQTAQFKGSVYDHSQEP